MSARQLGMLLSWTRSSGTGSRGRAGRRVAAGLSLLLLLVVASPSAGAQPAVDPRDGQPGGALEGIQWCSTNHSVTCAVKHVSVPLIVIPGQAHYFLWDAEQIYEAAASPDKEFIVGEGLSHGLVPCADCPGGPYPNAATNLWNHVDDWATTRFSTPGATVEPGSCNLSEASATYLPGTSNIAVLMIHRSQDFRVLAAPQGAQLSARGFHALLMKSRFADDASVDWENIALDIRAGVRCLRSLPGVNRVVLVGWSGGGPASAFYQAVAENGAPFCQMPGKLTKCTDQQMSGWVDSDRADGLALTDSHEVTNALFRLDASVTDEDHPDRRDPSLDPFNEANGYNPDGDSQYSAAFVERYWAGQARRMNILIARAKEMRSEIERGERDPDDDAFSWQHHSGRLQQISTGVFGCTSQPRRLLQDDGAISEPQIVCTVRKPSPRQKEENDGGEDLTVTSFLSSEAIVVSLPAEEQPAPSSTPSVPRSGAGATSPEASGSLPATGGGMVQVAGMLAVAALAALAARRRVVAARSD